MKCSIDYMKQLKNLLKNIISVNRILDDINEIYNLLNNEWRNFCDSKILITGATGFFGKSIVNAFLYANNKRKLNIELYIVSRNKKITKSYFSVNDENDALRFIYQDIKHFKSGMDDINYIIHAASNSDKNFITKNSLETIKTIIFGTANILDFSIKQNNLKSFLFISSGAINYANLNTKRPISEQDIYPIKVDDSFSAYSLAKKTAENMILSYSKTDDLPVKILRGFTFLGPEININQNLAWTYILKCFLDSKDIKIKNSECKRSYMYSTDLVNWIIKVLVKARKGSIYNLGSDELISITDLAREVIKFNRNLKVTEEVSETSDFYVPDISNIKKDLNLVITVPVKEGIKRVIDFYSE